MNATEGIDQVQRRSQGAANSLQSSRSYRFFLGLLSGYGATSFAMIASLALTPFSLRFVTRDEYALFVLIADVLLWLNILDLGANASLRAQAALLVDHPNKLKINRLASNAFFAQLAMSGFLFIICLSISAILPRIFYPGHSAPRGASIFVILLAIGATLNFGTQTFAALLTAHQNIHVNNVLQIFQLFIRTILSVLLLVRGWGLFGLVLAYLCSTIITCSLTVLACYAKIPSLAIKPGLVSGEFIFKSLRNLTVWFNIGNIAGIVIQNMDRFVAGALISLASVTSLTLTGRTYLLAGTMLTQLTTMAMPGLGQIIGSGKEASVYEVYKRLLHASVGGAVVASTSIFAVNGQFVALWVGRENYGGAMIDSALALNLVAIVWTLPHRALLVSHLNVRSHALVRIAEALINIALSILLTVRYGLIGVAASTTIATCLTSAWMLPRLSAELFGLEWKRLVWDMTRPLILPTLLLIAFSCVARRIVAVENSLMVAVLVVSFVASTGCALVWRCVFDRETRAKATGVLKRVRA